jgi:glycerate kinase
VRAPLLGPAGAAAVFGPQKGAGPADIGLLEAGLARLAEVLGGNPDAPGAGAAGGCAYGLAAAWSAALQPGAERVAAIAGLPAALTGADLVITGEGRYDATSLTGKVVGAVLAAAERAGVVTAIVAGRIDMPTQTTAVELTAVAGSSDDAIDQPGRWLAVAGRMLATGHGPASAS